MDQICFILVAANFRLNTARMMMLNNGARAVIPCMDSVLGMSL